MNLKKLKTKVLDEYVILVKPNNYFVSNTSNEILMHITFSLNNAKVFTSRNEARKFLKDAADRSDYRITPKNEA